MQMNKFFTRLHCFARFHLMQIDETGNARCKTCELEHIRSIELMHVTSNTVKAIAPSIAGILKLSTNSEYGKFAMPRIGCECLNNESEKQLLTDSLKAILQTAHQQNSSLTRQLAKDLQFHRACLCSFVEEEIIEIISEINDDETDT